MMSRRDAVNFALSSVGAMVLMMGVLIIGPYLETKFWPAYSAFEIESVEPYEGGKSKVVFRYTKYRQCEPQGFSWFAGELGAAYRQINIRSLDGPQPPRQLGQNLSNTYVVDVPPNVLINGTFAEIYSKCHFLWTTRSEIYP